MGGAASLPEGLAPDVRAYLGVAGPLGNWAHLLPISVIRAGYLLGSMHDSKLLQYSRNVTTSDVSFQTAYAPGGESSLVTIRLYRPSFKFTPSTPGTAVEGESSKESSTLPPAIVLYCHGGGFTIGSIRSHDGMCRCLAVESQTIVASVEYSLGPEHTFTTPINPLDDCVAAYAWLVRNAGGLLGVSTPVRIAISGDSAGAHLSINIARRIRSHNANFIATHPTDEAARAGKPTAAIPAPQPVKDATPGGGGDDSVGPVSRTRLGKIPGCDAPLPMPCLIAPLYPVTDYSSNSASRQAYGAGLELTSGLITVFNDCSLGPDTTLHAALKRDVIVSPLLSTDLAGFPPTLLLTSQFDVLHDEGVEFAHALTRSGVPTLHVEAVGQIHGFVTHMDVLPSALRIFVSFAHSMRDFLATGTFPVPLPEAGSTGTSTGATTTGELLAGAGQGTVVAAE